MVLFSLPLERSNETDVCAIESLSFSVSLSLFKSLAEVPVVESTSALLSFSFSYPACVVFLVFFYLPTNPLSLVA